MTEQMSSEEVLANHALWVHVETGKQPSACSCGYVFRLGDSYVHHQTKALREAGYLQ